MWDGEEGRKAYLKSTDSLLDSYIQSDALVNSVFIDVDYICQQLDTLTKEELEYVSAFCQRLIDLK